MPTRSLLPLLAPEGLVLLAAAAAVHWGAAHPAAAPLLPVYPVAVLVAGLLLSWRFHRGRLLLALLALTLADRALLWLPTLDPATPAAGIVAVRSVAMLLPVTLAVLALLREASALSGAGQRRLLALLIAVASLIGVAMVAVVHPEPVTQAFDWRVLPGPWLTWSPIGEPASLAAALAVLTLVARVLWRPDPESRGFLWAAVGSVIALTVGVAEGRTTLYFASAALVIVVATLERVYALAYHDELTGLPARRALQEALLRAQDGDGTYTVAMVDVDHFKKFNDTHGHDVGDQVLRLVATQLSQVDGGGTAFRYGGEEFTVLFPGLSVEESAPYLEALRTAVAEASFTVRSKHRPRRKPKSGRRPRAVGTQQLSVTVSIGAAEAAGAGVPIDAVIKAADRALYRAKEGGRNRLEVA